MITLSMITEYLHDFEICHINITHSTRIKSVRVCEQVSELKANILYLKKNDNSDTTYCFTNDGSSFSVVTDLLTAFNCILDAVEFYNSWINTLKDVCRKGCTLTELLDICTPMLNYPMIILDSNESMIAHTTAFDLHNTDEQWNYMIKNGTIPASVIAEYNKQYYDYFMKRNIYRIPGDTFKHNGYAVNLFIDNSFCGLVILVDPEDDITQGIVDTFSILCNIIQDMIASSAINAFQDNPGKPLYNYISHNDPESKEELMRILKLSLWENSDTKAVIYAEPSISSSLAPDPVHSRIIFSKLEGLIVSYFQNGLILLCNKRILNSHSSINQILNWLSQISYCAGISRDFDNIDEMTNMFHQAYIALTNGSHDAGAVNMFNDHIVPYLIELIKKEDGIILSHPVLKLLLEYDRHNGSRLYETLFEYLKNERSIAKTAEALNVHRSTLIHRLDRLEEVLPESLNNAASRLYLLLSYYANN